MDYSFIENLGYKKNNLIFSIYRYRSRVTTNLNTWIIFKNFLRYEVEIKDPIFLKNHQELLIKYFYTQSVSRGAGVILSSSSKSSKKCEDGMSHGSVVSRGGSGAECYDDEEEIVVDI